MTRSWFRIAILLAVSPYAALLSMAAVLYYMYCIRGHATQMPVQLDTYLKVAALITPPLGAAIVYATQRRLSYLQQLRSVCSDAITAVEAAILYSRSQSKPEEKWLTARAQLSSVIEEIRTLYKNVRESKNNRGLYPYEGLKTILTWITELGCSELGPCGPAPSSGRVEQEISKTWKAVRESLFRELERRKPTYHHTDFR